MFQGGKGAGAGGRTLDAVWSRVAGGHLRAVGHGHVCMHSMGRQGEGDETFDILTQDIEARDEAVKSIRGWEAEEN